MAFHEALTLIPNTVFIKDMWLSFTDAQFWFKILTLTTGSVTLGRWLNLFTLRIFLALKLRSLNSFPLEYLIFILKAVATDIPHFSMGYEVTTLPLRHKRQGCWIMLSGAKLVIE